MIAMLLSRRALLAGLAVSAVHTGTRATLAETMPGIVVSKNPTCGCCSGWVDHLRQAGFSAAVIETSETNRVKVRLGVPQDLASCHTAEIGG
jgi:hypothetical protein